ncbi:hypothetical protein AGMMS50293_14230 [Spirochaetia bacterium]|nr:hypothetical protein AGMMS50293_14230 [Spirochaetia bacterium]
MVSGDSNEPYNDTETAKFFYAPEYDDFSKMVTIRPGDNANGTKPSPAEVIITVTVGTKVTGVNGNSMTAPVSFYYFTVTPSTTQITDSPDHVKIVALDYAALNGGSNNSIERSSQEFDAITMAELTPAKAAYQANAAGTAAVYSVEYHLDETIPAIYRLAALDNQAPQGEQALTLGGALSHNTSTNADTWGGANTILALDANFITVNDNGGVGLLPMNASQEKPWTQDIRENIKWQWRLVHSTDNTVKYESGWKDITVAGSSATGSGELDLSTLSTITSSNSDVYVLQTRFQDNVKKDGTGNVSGWSGNLAGVKYYNATLNPVGNLSATVNTAGNVRTRPGLPSGIYRR